MTRFVFSGLTCALGALALASCGHSPPTRLFTLEAAAPSRPALAAFVGPPVQVSAVHVPPALDRAELVSQIAPGELAIEELSHWAAPLGRISRQTLTEDLAARLPPGAVLLADAPSATADALSVDILALQVSGGEAVMKVGWTHSARSIRARRSVTTVLRRSGVAPGPAGTARAFSDLLGDLADCIVLDSNRGPT